MINNPSKILIVGGSGFVGSRLMSHIGLTQCINLDKNISEAFPGNTIIQDIRDTSLHKFFPKSIDTVILLAAEHRDDIFPTSLYYEVNVNGTKNVLDAMDILRVKNIIFTSSVAVYGLNKNSPDENHPVTPFNHYGKSKWLAEEALREWYYKDPGNRSLTIIRPTVIFGERNRGNVYNLLKQIASGRFLMVGNGQNIKSMAYVGNVVAFIDFCLNTQKSGYRMYNYTDGPDMNMNMLVKQIEHSLKKRLISIHLPYWMGYLAGITMDLVSYILRKKFSISSVRVKKFVATTHFNANAAHNSGFTAPYSLSEGLDLTLNYEFSGIKKDEIVYFTE
jgi:GlcNAc-P-P-Und epimerase